MQTDCNEWSPLLEIKPASARFRWLNLTCSLLAVIAGSHHIQPLQSMVQQNNSISFACIWEIHQDTLWSFYLTDGKPEKQQENKTKSVFLFSCLFLWQHDNPHCQDQQPFSIIKAKRSLPLHQKKTPNLLFAAFEQQAGEGFSTSVSSICLLFAAMGQETHFSVHQPLTLRESACKQGWKSFTLHLVELWEHKLLLNPAQLSTSGQESEWRVCLFWYSKEKRKII